MSTDCRLYDCNGTLLNREQLTNLLQDAAQHAAPDLDLSQGKVVYGAHLERQWPQLDWNRLLTLFGDNPHDWATIIKEYLEMADQDPEPAPADPEVAVPTLPLKVIGQAYDMFNSELRPVYNRDPLPAELATADEPLLLNPRPAAAPPPTAATRAASHVADTAAAIDRCFEQSETKAYQVAGQLDNRLKRKIGDAQDNLSDARHILKPIQEQKDPQVKEQLWTELCGQLAAGGVAMAQVMTLAWPIDQTAAPDAASLGPELSGAARRDLARIQEAADAARAGLVYWQGWNDALKDSQPG